jgi:cyanophycin synthetase
VTNIGADHLGLKGIDTLEKMARVKAVVPQSVTRRGYAVLNADDDLVYEMRRDLDCRIALYSLDENSPRIKKHCAKGRLAAVYEHGYITILKGNWKIRVEKVTDVPITFSGKAAFNIANVLGAVLAAYVCDFKTEDIRQALQTFIPSPAMTPGRMNMFHFKNFSIMLDYAHNTHGLKAIGKYVESVDAPKKVGLIAGVGDRRDEDLISLGEESARIFDEIIIRQDKNLRGRTEEEMIRLITQGIQNVAPDKPVMDFRREHDAIDYAIQHAVKDSFIVIISDVVPDALEQVKHYKDLEDGAVVE